MTESQKIFLHGKIVAICEAMLNGKIGIIAGSRSLQSLGFELFKEHNEDFLIFLGIDSQTDHLPVDKERMNWNLEALDRKDVEISEWEKFYSDDALSQCTKLVEKFRFPQS